MPRTNGASKYGTPRLSPEDVPTTLDVTDDDLIPEPPPDEVEASSARSPNRKPRYLSVTKNWSTRVRKRSFLVIYRMMGSLDEACKTADTGRTTIAYWMDVDENFAESIKAVQAMWAKLFDQDLHNMNRTALEVVRDSLTQTADPRLRAETAFKVLKSNGLLREGKTVTEHTGAGGGPIAIETMEVVPSHARVDAEGGMKELPSGDGDSPS